MRVANKQEQLPEELKLAELQERFAALEKEIETLERLVSTVLQKQQ